MKPTDDQENADRRTVRPGPDRRVRHPDGRLLEGAEEVVWSTYWQRRLDDGDVVAASPKKDR
jgi:hypothetical protein